MQLKIIFLITHSTKTYLVGTQKNLLNVTDLLSTQNICLNCQMGKKIITILRSNLLLNSTYGILLSTIALEEQLHVFYLFYDLWNFPFDPVKSEWSII